MNNFKRLLNEGTWSLPDTHEKKAELKKLLKRPLSAHDSTTLLYDLIGDDKLWDDIHRASKEYGPNTDVRHMVTNYLKSNKIRI